MGQTIVNSEAWTVLLGGGALRAEDLRAVRERTLHLVAADGGGDVALRHGVIPDAVIGDFDSLSDLARSEIPADRLHHIPEQDSTDFEKCLTRIDAPMILGLGFTGARIDHELAVYHVLTKYPSKRCVIVGEEDVCAHVAGDIEFDVELGSRVSLFPMGAVTGRSEGLRWPIDGIEFAPDLRVGTSNEATASRVRVSFDGPGMLLILPKDSLWSLVDGLLR
ncbi:thiamine diphosphokinase [Celeribacter litoreus]|uniref:thiamine diphosphokinase n=1 Tax=Celeribacter litoreus TaxID=2876714 RepID=UPI001CCE7975|nr:thiamine diphosphokinase [Celeribacter litoreus]MCA0045187.1 thiamine diphosphokinase [Celeribacter litoreus]